MIDRKDVNRHQIDFYSMYLTSTAFQLLFLTGLLNIFIFQYRIYNICNFIANEWIQGTRFKIAQPLRKAFPTTRREKIRDA